MWKGIYGIHSRFKNHSLYSPCSNCHRSRLTPNILPVWLNPSCRRVHVTLLNTGINSSFIKTDSFNGLLHYFHKAILKAWRVSWWQWEWHHRALTASSFQGKLADRQNHRTLNLQLWWVHFTGISSHSLHSARVIRICKKKERKKGKLV